MVFQKGHKFTKSYSIDKSNLRKLYLEDKKSSEIIAKEINVSPSVVLRRLKEFNIPIRNPSDRALLSIKTHGHPLLGKKMSEETKRKIGNGNRGKIKTIEERKRMSERWKQVPHTEEWNKKVGLALSGKKKSKEHCINIKKSREYIRGKTYEEVYGEKKANKIKNKISVHSKLENNNMWKGGKSFEPYGLSFNNIFKRRIRKRDNQICMMCGIHREKINRALNVHHINYDKLLSVLQNCISLCDSCHSKTNVNRKYWIKFFQSILSEKYNYQYSEIGEPILNICGELINE